MNPNDLQPQQPIQPEQPMQPQPLPNQPQPQPLPSQPQVFTPPQPAPQQLPPQEAAYQPAYPEQPAQPFVPQQSYAPPLPASNSKRLIMMIVAGIVVIAVIIGAVLVLTHKKNDGNTAGSKASSSKSAVASSGSEASTSKTACQLFTLENAKSVMGATASDTNSSSKPISSPNVTISSCRYTGLGTISLASIQVTSYSDKTKADNGYSVMKQALQATTSVSGVGDSATWSPSANALFAQKGKVLVQSRSSGQGIDEQATDIQILKAVFSNL